MPHEEHPRPLDAGPVNVLFDVWLLSRAVNALIDEAIRPGGLDADASAIYSVLASSESITPSELARWMSAPATTVSSSVKRFEQRGHVERVPNPDDGRSRRLRLTASGRRVHRRAGELFAPILARVEQRIGGDSNVIHGHLRDLHRIVHGVDSRDE
ncbi:MAG: MarR family winged helix-turn-helix transcriptional regulator [Ilumatobacter sp.]